MSSLSALAIGQSLVALDALEGRPLASGETPTKRREEHADQARLIYTGRVELHRTTTPIEIATLAGNVDRARQTAAGILQRIADENGLSRQNLIRNVRERVQQLASMAPVTAKQQDTSMRAQIHRTGPIQLGADALKSYETINEFVGQWKLKRGVAQLMQRAQLRAMLGDDVVGDGCNHIQLLGMPATGKSTVLELLPALVRDLRYTISTEKRIITGGSLVGTTEGFTTGRILDTFRGTEEGFVGIDEIQSLKASATSRGAEMVYAPLNQALTSPEFRRVICAVAGYGFAVRKFFEGDIGLERRFPNVLELTSATVDELTHMFLRNCAIRKWQIDTPTYEAVQKFFRRIVLNPSLVNAGYVKSCMNGWESNIAERVLEDLTSGALDKSKARILLPADVRPLVGTYAPLIAFDDDVTVEEVVEELRKDVINQDHILTPIAEELVMRRRLPAITEETSKPVGRHIYAGPSAAGKSLLCKSIARLFMTAEDREAGRAPPVFRVEMNGIGGKDNTRTFAAYLGGAQPGYIGFDRDCPLIEWMKNNPGGVIEFAEIDKGPKDAIDVLMEIYDTGLFTPQAGKPVDFRNYVTVGTGNYGNQEGVHTKKTIEKPLAKRVDAKPGEVWALGAMQNQDGVVIGGGIMRLTVKVGAGKGEVRVTANARKVMEESAKIAHRYVKEHGKALGLSEDIVNGLAHKDIDIYYTPAASEKDGPSAGITTTSAIVSALLGKTIPPNIAMTGEIAVNGEVGPIGGVREKIFAGLQQGCDTFFLPEANRRDVEALPDSLRNRVRVIFAERFEQVLEGIFDPANAVPVSTAPLEPDIERQVVEARVDDFMERIMRPEQRGRLSNGKAFVFQMHDEDTLRRILNQRIGTEGAKQLAHADLTMTLDKSAEDYMHGFWNDATGPRPVIGAMNLKLISPLLLEQTTNPAAFPRGSEVTVSIVKGKPVFTATPPAVPEDLAGKWATALTTAPSVAPTSAPKTLVATWRARFSRSAVP